MKIQPPPSLKKGETIHVGYTGGDRNQSAWHLFVILTDRSPKGEYLAVPFSSCDGKVRFDQTCIVTANSHVNLPKQSFVAYYLLRAFTDKIIEAHIFGNRLERVQPISDTLLERIISGIRISPEVEPRWVKFIEEHGA